MDFKSKRIDEWFLMQEVEAHLPSLFPHRENYFTRYKDISSQLIRWVHPEVTTGAAMLNQADSGLTNHGVDHVYTLLGRVTQLLDKNPHCSLSLFEIYLLLMSVHVHDVGNIMGRKNHEFNSRVIITHLGAGVANQDQWIWDYIYDIAKAHKDLQIHTLAQQDFLHDFEFRPQLLAAVLKLADELAENFSRASNINLVLNNVPVGNQLYHAFASAVNSIIPNAISREIVMSFNLTEEILSRTFQKGNEEIYLIDEIYLRTLRTYSERVYCMQFMRPLINFDTVTVKISLKMKTGQKYENGYKLTEMGITNFHMDEVIRMCPALKGMSGKEIHQKIKDKKNLLP
jgi:hypothetical protein